MRPTTTNWRIVAVHRDGLERLAWTARADLRKQQVEVFCGSNVEVGEDWVFEGIWNAPFSGAGFDNAAEVYGSGLRTRGDLLTFVAPSTTTERIWYTTQEEVLFASNSLPLLLAHSDSRLHQEVHKYSALSAQSPAEPAATAVMPGRPAPIGVLAHHNLQWRIGSAVTRVGKPSNRGFRSYEDYHGFLLETADKLKANATNAEREHRIAFLTTISSGYDSPAAAVMAKHMGCSKAVTIESARSLFPRSDSGAAIAERLGLECETHPRAGRGTADEIYFWAALGHPQDEHFATFEYPKPVSLLFSGQYGGNIWAIDHHFRSPFERSDWSGLGFAEYRLKEGVIHCPVPFWGSDRYEDIHRVSTSPEMEPWNRDGEYDRPIPRRIVEEAGVDAEMFGTRKSATQYDDTFLWPRQPELSDDYHQYLKNAGYSSPPVALARILSTINENLLFPLEQRIYGREHPRVFWETGQRLVFVWANERLAARYRAVLS